MKSINEIATSLPCFTFEGSSGDILYTSCLTLHHPRPSIAFVGRHLARNNQDNINHIFYLFYNMQYRLEE